LAWPAGLFYQIGSPIALAFLQRFPTPSSAARLGEKRLAAFLKGEGYSGRHSVTELLARPRAAPVGQIGKLEEQARGELVLALTRVVAPLLEQIAAITARIQAEVAQLEDGVLLMTLPYAGHLTAAKLLAEIGNVRERLTTADQLAAEAGVAPVTKQSGKSRSVTFRWACNHRLRVAITLLADNSRRGSPWAAHIYAAARARGCRHPHAVRILARAWVRVLWKVWTTLVPYDIKKHAAAYALVSGEAEAGSAGEQPTKE
jgi:transposase